MSLLLKALEKSEQDKEGEASKAPAAKEGAAGGMKLAGGDTQARPSKLSSALSSKKTDEAQAGRVVSAYEQGETTFDDAVVKAAKQARNRNIFVYSIVFVLAIGGYFAYQRFAPQFISQQTPDTVADSGASTSPADSVSADVDIEANLLPLSDPLYDIQESIILASTGTGADGSGESAGANNNIADNIQQLVTDILEAQVESEGAASEAAAALLQEEEIDPLTELLNAEFDIEAASEIDTTSDMLARLEELGQVRPLSSDGKYFVKPSSVSLEEAIDNTSNEVEEPVREQPVLIAKQDNTFKDLMQQGANSYQTGNYNSAENAFRTIIAREPQNSQALLGLAKVHQARGSTRLAVATLLKAAEYSPDNPTIIGELISLQSSSADPLIARNSISVLLTKTDNPISQSRLLFVLGTIYAKQQDWLGAKTAFFEANTLDRSNPDVAYNLAVVLDYLNESNNAIDAYQHALDVAERLPSSFDHDVVRKRISQLEAK